MSDTPLSEMTPHVTAVVGTPEFQDKHTALVLFLHHLGKDKYTEARRILDAIDAACLQAYEDGFNEGLCK